MFYDVPIRFTEMTSKLCNELDRRVAGGASVYEKGVRRILLLGVRYVSLIDKRESFQTLCKSIENRDKNPYLPIMQFDFMILGYSCWLYVAGCM